MNGVSDLAPSVYSVSGNVIFFLKTASDLGRVDEVEGLVEAEVDEAEQCGVELCKRGHNSVVYICRVLNRTRVHTHTHTFFQ